MKHVGLYSNWSWDWCTYKEWVNWPQIPDLTHISLGSSQQLHPTEFLSAFSDSWLMPQNVAPHFYFKENKGSLEIAHHISVFLLKFTGPLSQFDAERCVQWLFSVFSSWVETMSWLTPISRKIILQTASIRLGIFRVFIIVINTY
jgi:hypothetical protein